jgi:hypothetical protein
MRLVAAAALVLSTALAFAQETAPGNRVYVLHSEAQGTCPSLNWHVMASPTGILSGMFAWDNMKMVASVAGVIDPLVPVERFGKPLGSNPQTRAFHMIATEVGGKDRIADITGTIEQNG